MIAIKMQHQSTGTVYLHFQTNYIELKFLCIFFNVSFLLFLSALLSRYIMIIIYSLLFYGAGCFVVNTTRNLIFNSQPMLNSFGLTIHFQLDITVHHQNQSVVFLRVN